MKPRLVSSLQQISCLSLQSAESRAVKHHTHLSHLDVASLARTASPQWQEGLQWAPGLRVAGEVHLPRSRGPSGNAAHGPGATEWEGLLPEASTDGGLIEEGGKCPQLCLPCTELRIHRKCRPVEGHEHL